MAHPYKQKYNNFNGPGHQSPTPYIAPIGRFVAKKVLKPISNKLDDIWQATKKTFGPSRKWDNSIDWTKTKSDIGKMTIGGTIIGKGISGLEEGKEKISPRFKIDRDNIPEPQSIKLIDDKFKIKKEINLDSLLKAYKNANKQ